jgi:predicted metal-dependent hydrolase
MKPLVYRAGVVSRSQQSFCPSETLPMGAGHISVLFLKKPAAKRYILRMKDDGVLRVTIPRGGSRNYAQEFALKNADWIQKQVEKVKSRPRFPEIWQHGTEILFRGERVKLQVHEDTVSFADQSLPLAAVDGNLTPMVLRHLQQLAVKELSQRTIELAKQHQLTIRRVTIRSQRSRWGSCSTNANISLNWRLIQTPAYVAEYIILHELMHLKQMNHSARFWKCVAEVCPDYARAEAWLKAKPNALTNF